MPRIPIYTSRASAPGPIPGLGDDLARPGRALARLGGVIAGFGEDLARRNARKKAAERLRQMQVEADSSEPLDDSAGTPERVTPEHQEAAIRQAGDKVSAVLDHATDDALISVIRADALSQASLDAEPEQLTARALAYFDATAAQLIEGTGDASRRARLQGLVRDARDVLIERAEHRRHGHLAAILNEKLATALGGYADAVRRDPAMLAAMLQKGADTIAEAARLAGLAPERVEAMAESWTRQAHVALVEGMIERDPASAVALLEGGKLTAQLGADRTVTGRLTRWAETALAAAEAERLQRERTRRTLFEVDKAEYLERIRRTGRGDPDITARADALPDPGERAAFSADVAAAETQYAARSRYAFMTAEEIDADISDKAPGGGPRDTDERVRDHEARVAARDEILAERDRDPAGWAMLDETVSQAFAAAEQAAPSPESGLRDAEQADRLFQRALALRMQVQADMGETPRLLTDAERDALAAELQALPPNERLARIGGLRRRYDDHFGALAAELAGRIGPDTEILMAWSRDPILAGLLARGMAMERVAYNGAVYRSLPVPDGKLDTSRLEDKQLYRFMAGNRVVDVVYDRRVDALVPTNPDGDGAMQPIGTTALESAKETAIRTFSPAPYLNDAAIATFREKTRHGLRRGDGGFTLADPAGHDMFSLSEDEAAVLAHIWTPEIAPRVEATGALWREDLSPDEKRRRIQAAVYKDIPEALRSVSPSGPNWISMEGGDPEDFGQRLAARRLEAFDAVAAAIESGATEQEIANRVGEFQEAMLPEVFGLGRVIKEFLMDIAPGLGNIRGIRHLQNDVAELQHAVDTGEWGDAAMASGMAILDAIGIFPGLNTAKGIARGIGRGIPYANRPLGERSFRRLMRQWNETGKKFASIKVEDLVGDLIDGLDPKIRKSFTGLVRNRVGIVGEERTFEDVIKRMDPQASKQVRIELPRKKGSPTKTRVFDALATLPSEEIEIANALLGRLARWFVAAGDEVIGGTKGARKMIETKTGKLFESYAQEMAREWLAKNPEVTLRKAGADGFANLRNAPSEIPIEFLVQDVSEYLDGWVSKGRISKDVSDKLQLAMRQLKARGIESVRLEDYVGFLARLNAALLRDGGDVSGDMMSDPAGTS